MAKIRVLVADDSPTWRAVLRHMLESSDAFSVVGEARNGDEAVAMAVELRPALITMDLELAGCDGPTAISRIMSTKAVPILVVSGASASEAAYRAVAMGALDVVAKPQPAQAAEFIAKAKLLAGVPVITRLPRPPRPAPPCMPGPVPAPPGLRRRVFVIAASTGGPQVLARILPALPVDFPAPILVAQHISDGFAQGMAQWLDGLCGLGVELATAGGVPTPAKVHISPSEASLYLDPKGRMMLAPHKTGDLYHPSCDRLLCSAAVSAGRDAVGIILTGMGHDGVEGMARIRAAGGVTIGQDEASSTIYGMNREAIEGGHVATVLPPEAIVEHMIHLAGSPLAGGAP